MFSPAAAAVITILILAVASPARAEDGRALSGEPVGTFDISRVIHFDMEEGWLTAEPAVPAELMTGAELPIRIRGSRAAWSVRSSPSGTPTDERFIEISYKDPGQPLDEGNCSASVQCRCGYTSISGTHRLNGETVYVLYRAWRDADTVQVEAYVQEGGELTRTLLNARGATLQEVWCEHPSETNRYLGPVLRKISRRNLLGPGAADVYAAFAALRPQPHAAEALMALLPKLDAPQPSIRLAASAKLAKMGRQGVLAAMRLDDLALSPEQQARINGFVASHRRRNMETPAQMQRDAAFLTECLDDEELEVRQAAKDGLQALTGKPIHFDPQLEGDERLDAVNQVRHEIQGIPDATARR